MIKVTGCRLLIKPFKLQEHDKVWARAKALGIEIPEQSQRKEEINIDRGTVLQVGPNCHQDYVGEVSVNDVIGYAKFGGKFIKDVDDEVYLVINDEDVICIFKEDK